MTVFGDLEARVAALEARLLAVEDRARQARLHDATCGFLRGVACDCWLALPANAHEVSCARCDAKAVLPVRGDGVVSVDSLSGWGVEGGLLLCPVCLDGGAGADAS